MTDVEFLHGVDILSTLTSEELEIVRSHLEEISCEADHPVFHQGDEGNELFIVREGHVAIRVRTSDGGEVDVAELGPGDFFGEMAIFEDAPRSATCVMSDGGRVYRLRKGDLFALMDNHPDAAGKVLYRMVGITTHRLHDTSAFLSDLVQWGEGARRRAITDDLTGLYNRRYLDNALDEQVVESNVKNQVFSVIMMDLDNFHGINETYGQQFGDAVIAAVAPCITGCLGERDVASRYGGDEFTIILPDTRADRALAIAEEIRRRVAALELTEPGGGRVTLTTSQGVAEFPAHGNNAERIKEAADSALYKAKEAGRDRAVSL